MKTILTILAVAAGSSLWAQEPATPFDETRCRELLLRAVHGNAQAARDEDRNHCSPAAGGGCMTPPNEIALLAGDEDGRAFLRYEVKQPSHDQPTYFTTEVSTPFNKEKKEGVFATASKVSGDIALTTEAGFTSWAPLRIEAYADQLCSACAQNRVKTLLECNPESLTALLSSKGLRTDEAEKAGQAISDAAFAKVVGARGGFKLELGRETREFFTAEPKVAEENRVGYAVGVNGNLWFRNGLMELEVLQKRDFEEAKPATHCAAIEGSSLEECTTKPRSRAEDVDSLVSSIVWKVQLSDHFALAPRLERDFEANVWDAQLPVYVFSDEDRALTGGVRLGWNSDDNDLTAAVFVSKPLF